MGMFTNKQANQYGDLIILGKRHLEWDLEGAEGGRTSSIPCLFLFRKKPREPWFGILQHWSVHCEEPEKAHQFMDPSICHLLCFHKR